MQDGPLLRDQRRGRLDTSAPRRSQYDWDILLVDLCKSDHDFGLLERLTSVAIEEFAQQLPMLN